MALESVTYISDLVSTNPVSATDNVLPLPGGQPSCTATAGVTGSDLTRGGTFPLGTSTVTCSARDAVGNTSDPKTFTVTVSSAGYSGLDGVYANGSKSRTSAVPLDFGFKGTTGTRVNSSLARPSVKVYYAGVKCPGTKPANPTFTTNANTPAPNSTPARHATTTTRRIRTSRPG